MGDIRKISCGIFMLGLAVVSSAYAGPRVTITFKNNGDAAAEYDFIGSSAYSYAEANPKPSETVLPGESNRFDVWGRQSANVTTAVFQYRMGLKTCRFQASYLKLPSRGGSAPKWNKQAESTGGARCDVRLVSTDMRNHDWAVEFTMR